jgi:DNA-binding protein H-NS
MEIEMNLHAMSLGELKELQRNVARAIASFEDRKKKEALLALEEKARELGFSIAELTGAKVMRTRAPVAAKYANPDNPADTWSGRGRKPKWFTDALAAGRTPADLSV